MELYLKLLVGPLNYMRKMKIERFFNFNSYTTNNSIIKERKLKCGNS